MWGRAQERMPTVVLANLVNVQAITGVGEVPYLDNKRTLCERMREERWLYVAYHSRTIHLWLQLVHLQRMPRTGISAEQAGQVMLSNSDSTSTLPIEFARDSIAFDMFL